MHTSVATANASWLAVNYHVDKHVRARGVHTGMLAAPCATPSDRGCGENQVLCAPPKPSPVLQCPDACLLWKCESSLANTVQTCAGSRTHQSWRHSLKKCSMLPVHNHCIITVVVWPDLSHVRLGYHCRSDPVQVQSCILLLLQPKPAKLL